MDVDVDHDLVSKSTRQCTQNRAQLPGPTSVLVARVALCEKWSLLSGSVSMDLGDEPVFHVGDWVEVMRMDGNDVDMVRLLHAGLSCLRLRDVFETWYRVNFVLAR